MSIGFKNKGCPCMTIELRIGILIEKQWRLQTEWTINSSCKSICNENAWNHAKVRASMKG